MCMRWPREERVSWSSFCGHPQRGAYSSWIHRHGALVACQVGSRDEAIAAVEAGCDIIVAQCVEAGGHVRGTIGILALLDEVLDAINVPVLAAGGIGSGRAIAAVLAAGADGVRVGTRFVAAEESGVHPTYARAVVDATARDSVYTEAFSVGWPNAPHRVLRSSLEAAEAFGRYRRPERAHRRWIGSLVTFRLGRRHARQHGRDRGYAYVGGGVSWWRHAYPPAAAILGELIVETERLLQRVGRVVASVA